MKPSPVLQKRLKARIPFTTKHVAKGFYRGNRTGALGAHTQYGGYLIDWRRVRHYVVPKNLKDFKLKPFVDQSINAKRMNPENSQGELYEPEKMNVMEFLRQWKEKNPYEYQNEVKRWSGA